MPENIDAHGFVTIIPDEPNTPAEPAEGTVTKENLRDEPNTPADPAEGTVTPEEPVEKKQVTPEKPKASSRPKKANT